MFRYSLQCSQAGKDAPAILNAANEVAVDAFLNGKIGFTSIANIVEQTLTSFDFYEPESLDAVQESDTRARVKAVSIIEKLEF